MRRYLLLPLLCLLLLAATATPAPADGKIPVQSLTDLPARSYPVQTSVTELLASPEAMARLRSAVREDIEGILDTYDVKDPATLKGFYSTLLALDLLEGRDEQALEWIPRIQDLEEKEAARLLTGLTAKAVVAARRAGPAGSEAYQKTFTETLRASYQALPWEVVQDQLQQQKAMAELFSANLLAGMVQSQMDPVVEKSHELSGPMADGLIGMELSLSVLLPLKEQRVAVLDEVVGGHQETKPDIWPERSVTLTTDMDLAPVIIGIWDSGVDTTVFDGLLWTNPDESLDGKDDDGNGFVDDVHGIAFDLSGQATPTLLHPEGDQAGKVQDAMQYMKGLSDLQANLDTPAAGELRAEMGSLPPDQVEAFMTSLGFVGLYSHGTHVAGIATEGNPFARILVARITFDYHNLPAPVTEEIARRHAASYEATVDYFTRAGVRAVNMSWGWTFREIENSLEANGLGGSAEERKALAEKIFSILDEGLHSAMESTPEILYCVAAGNDDADVEFSRTIPSSYELPNVVVVGAVDQAGERTGFTSMGENVVLYANGFEVESYVPGGQRMAFSGTSMASPNALNLAAKLLALDPSLHPGQVIELMVDGADTLPQQPRLKLLNPKASVALLKQRSR